MITREQTSQTSSSSGKEVPKTRLALEEKYKEEGIQPSKRVDETNVDSIQDQLPTPSGWRLLVLPFTPKDKTKGGIIVAQETLDRLQNRSELWLRSKDGPRSL